MSPRFSDPNNHVPELSPDDGWGDAETSSSATTALPPRRSVANRAGPAAEIPQGLRIEPNVARTESAVRLEVQEIGAGVIRLEEVAPSPPKVERQVTFHERPVRERIDAELSGEKPNWGISRRHPTRWILGAGVVITAAVVGSMMMLPSINAPNRGRALPTAEVVIEDTIKGTEAMERMFEKQPEAMRIYRSYVTATHADEILPLLRGGVALQETLREHWRSSEIPKTWEPAAESLWTVSQPGEFPVGVLEGTLPNDQQFAAFFTNESDRLVMDWKATTAFGTASFKELEKGRGNPAEIRGVISANVFYSSTWPEADFRSYRLISPDGENAVWCYVPRGSISEATLTPLLEKGEIVEETVSFQKITLRLERGADSALPNQWQVAELLHTGWVNPNSPR